MSNLNFTINRKNAGALNAASSVFTTTLRVAIAVLGLYIFLLSHVVFAEEGSQQRSAGQLLIRRQKKYETKIRESLNFQKDFGNPAEALRTLDRLCGEIKRKIKPRSKYNKKEAVKALEKISGVLRKDGHFEFRRNVLLIEGLNKEKNGRRFIDCDDYSSLYLVAGEYLGLSLEPVYAPGHVFLLCRLDDKTHFYWEPSIAEEKDIGYYRRWLNIYEGSGYPKVLNLNEFEAIQFCNLGVAWYKNGDYTMAIKHLKRALMLNPSYAVALNNIGAAYAKQGKFGVAVECYKKAIDINYNYATAFSNMGVAFYRLGSFQDSVGYFEKAIEVDPEYEKAYDHKMIALMKRGEYTKAFEFLREINNRK